MENLREGGHGEGGRESKGRGCGGITESVPDYLNCM